MLHYTEHIGRVGGGGQGMPGIALPESHCQGGPSGAGGRVNRACSEGSNAGLASRHMVIAGSEEGRWAR